MSIRAGGKNFQTKLKLRNFCGYILNNAPMNEPLYGDWLAVMDDVLRNHPCYEQIAMGQTYKIMTRRCPINPRNRQFYIEREDGSDTDFSYYKAIKGSQSKISLIKQALRQSVMDQVKEYKTEYFRQHQDHLGYVVCEETGLKIKMKNSHVDHIGKKFEQIVKDFFDMKGISSEDITLHRGGDNTTCWRFDDMKLYNEFIEYHEKEAKYRVVLDKVNLQKPQGSRAVF